MVFDSWPFAAQSDIGFHHALHCTATYRNFLFVSDENNTNKPIVTKPLIKINEKKKAEKERAKAKEREREKQKEISSKEDDRQSTKGRGNCYIEPVHQSNCVTSELYLIT